jgi:hypothetical protein
MTARSADAVRHNTGNHTGLGLFIALDSLLTAGISIRETGVAGEGPRFEVCVPKDRYRLPG